MSYTEQEIREASSNLIESFNELLTWRWEEEKDVLLAEFASGKAEQVISILQKEYTHEWNRKSIKQAPCTIKNELGSHAKLIKEQRIFTSSPTENQKSVAAILWPWGHGSTLSLRLTLIKTPYEYIQPIPSEGFFAKFLQRARGRVA